MKLALLTLLTVPALIAAEATLDGHKVHYVSEGRGDKAIVLVHGWTCDLTFWNANIPALAKSHRVIAVDLPGHGRSDKPRIDYTPALFARAVEAVMRHAGVWRAVLVGHSMGTPVVRQFHKEFPDKVTALVFVDGSIPRSRPNEEQRERFLKPMRDDYSGFAPKMIDSMFIAATPEALRNEIRAKMRATPEYVALSAMSNMFAPSHTILDPVPLPTLVIAQKANKPPDYEAVTRTIIPKLELHLWDDAGHFLMMEQPARFNGVVLAFLTQHGF